VFPLVFEGQLPFLVKFLAPGQPVSLQVHPSPENAAAGFAREEAAGVAIGDFGRSFKDRFHKPEMVFAVTEFDGLVGLRDLRDIMRLLDGYHDETMKGFARELKGDPTQKGARSCLGGLVQLAAGAVDRIVSESAALALTATGDDASAYATVGELAKAHPHDAGAVASLLLGRVRLAPGQCVFVPSGMPHAYLSGLAVEVMANSDNVFRAGLTSKFVDVHGLLANTAFEFGAAALLQPLQLVPGAHALRPAAEEFELAVVEPVHGSVVQLPTRGPRIAVCIEGDVTVTGDADAGVSVLLQPGDAAFVPDFAGELTISGRGRLVVAGVPGA
jgi:mannose-6-phosphate isomerase